MGVVHREVVQPWAFAQCGTRRQSINRNTGWGWSTIVGAGMDGSVRPR